MAFCDKCGAYIPIGETACPACGYDPEAEKRRAEEEEKRKAAEEERRRAEEEARRKAAEEAEARRKAAAEAEARRKAQAQESWAAQQRKQEEARIRAEQERRRQQTYTGGAAQSQYASQRTGENRAYQSQYTSQRTGSSTQWAPPWQERREHGQTQSQSYRYEEMRAKAADSAANQNLSILSYIPWAPTFLIPLFLRQNDDFARYHANQGLGLFLVTAGTMALGSVSGLIPAAGSVFAIYGMIRGISNVIKGKKDPLPLVGDWKLIKEKNAQK